MRGKFFFKKRGRKLVFLSVERNWLRLCRHSGEVKWPTPAADQIITQK
jgi:hypothetical protein